MSSVVKAVFGFFTDTNVSDSELPEQDSTPLPNTAGSDGLLGAVIDFFTHETPSAKDLPLADNEAPPPKRGQGTVKRARDEKAPVAAAANDAVATKLRESRANDLSKDDLMKFLSDAGEQVNDKSKKADLLKQAAKVVAGSASSPAKASPTKPAASPVKEETPRAEEKPDKSWTVSQLKAFAAANGVDVKGLSKKDDLLKAVMPKPAKRSASAKKK